MSMSEKRASFQSFRLQQARYLCRMTLEELGRKAEIKKQSLSQFEKGQRVPLPETAARLSSELKVPVEFFLRPRGQIESSGRSVIHYRSLKRTREVIKEQQRAAAILDLSAAVIDSLEEHIEYEVPDLSLTQASTSEDVINLSLDAIEDIAAQTRKTLGLGDGPISDVALLVENQAIPVIQTSLPNGMDGMSAWYGDRPFIVVSSGMSRARTRLNVAHEYGHLILHQDIHEESQLDEATFVTVEKQAWRFAQALLLPARSFLGEAYRVSLDALVNLKEKWGVSVASMIRRLAALSIIDRDQEKYLNIELRRRGWHTREPLDDVPREQSRLLGRAAGFLQETDGLPLHEFARESRLPLPFLADALEVDLGRLLPPAPQNVVQFRLKTGAG